jgi:hypothetical protein
MMRPAPPCVRAGLGHPQDAIARHLRIGETTLRKYYAAELLRGIDEANVQVAQTCFNMATGRLVVEDGKGGTTIKRVEPNPTMAIWWTKTRMGWREPPRDISGDATPLASYSPNATIIVRGGLPGTPGVSASDDEVEPGPLRTAQ